MIIEPAQSDDMGDLQRMGRDFATDDDLATAREKIMALERELRKYSQLEDQVTHHFAPGVYARELFIPAGALLTGKIHKTEHLNIISQGTISVSNMGKSITISAPHIMVSKPGTKRAGYAHTDTVWITIHPTEETDLLKIEEQVIAKDFAELQGVLEREDQRKIGVQGQ